ncbi:DUF3656 domain-containing U32 family peptidase [Pectinatus frisingensis]|uniref:DUF3656 domain-containing U32 family peptidase n=1 Tax=Pectinatus frisingensis TaxID=865 RepID=UPI0018C4CF65|nr:U32 family peptidase [Pectinatus frisingensis]
MVELLAPAGTWEAFKAAVESGADAIYLAGENFGARAFAANFDTTALKKAVDFAHLRNTAVHVTVNTLVDDSELNKLADYLLYLYSINVDAIIVQDLGVAKIARCIVPDLPLHASTQMSVNNLDSVKMMEKLHFSRVVLAREVSLNDIEFICRNTSIEIETFIHGAICVCYSGQCLMSSMIGGRSGNRGCCAQPCRLPYTLVDKNDNDLLNGTDAGQYLLSPRDMKTIDLLPQLIEAGVKSFKIEGRMKKPEYVAIAVNAYRNKIDDYYKKSANYNIRQTDKELSQIFNRDFTTAYLQGHQGKNMMSDRKPNNRGLLIGRVQKYNKKTFIADIKLSDELNLGDKIDFWVKVGGRVNMNVTAMKVAGESVETAECGDIVSIKLPGHVQEHDRLFKIADAKLNEKAKNFFNNSDPVRRIPLKINLSAHIGSPIKLQLSDDCGRLEFTADFVAERALKRPLTYDTVNKQMGRLGNTIYQLDELTCDIGADVMVPVSVLNDVRRQAVDKLLVKRRERFNHPAPDFTDWHKTIFHHAVFRPQKTSLITAVDSIDKLQGALKGGCDAILFGGDSYNHQHISIETYQQAVDLCHCAEVKIYLAMPRILCQSQMKYMDLLFSQLDLTKFAGIYAHTAGQIRKINIFRRDTNINLPLWADFSMNTFNSACLTTLADMDVQAAVLSPELNLQQIKNLSANSHLPLEVIVSGNIELMVSEYCAIGSFLGNLHKGNCTAPCHQNRFYLKDRKSEHFPVVTDQFCHMHILNGRKLVMLAHIPDVQNAGISRIRIDGRYETANKLESIVKIYHEVLQRGKHHKIFKSNSIESIEGTNFTRGHFFRGILNNE